MLFLEKAPPPRLLFFNLSIFCEFIRCRRRSLGSIREITSKLEKPKLREEEKKPKRERRRGTAVLMEDSLSPGRSLRVRVCLITQQILSLQKNMQPCRLAKPLVVGLLSRMAPPLPSQASALGPWGWLAWREVEPCSPMAHAWPGTVPGTGHARRMPGSQQLCRAGLMDPFYRWESRPGGQSVQDGA